MARSQDQPSLGQEGTRRSRPCIGDIEDLGGGVLPMGGMCYLNEWPKSFLKAVIRHYSHHQVKKLKNGGGFLHAGELTPLLPPWTWVT